MRIIDFEKRHVEQAIHLLRANYEEERSCVTALPPFLDFPVMDGFVDNRLGVAAMEKDEFLGFLCVHDPFENAFGAPGVCVFSPIEGHGAMMARENVCTRLYQAAAEKWTSKGITLHAVSLYAHDAEALKSFWYNGFGLVCIDAIRPLDAIEPASGVRCEFRELPTAEFSDILPLKIALTQHFSGSPSFLAKQDITKEQMLAQLARRRSRVFVAQHSSGVIAYAEIADAAENIICDDPSMMNICGAFCMPEYRGTGIYHNLLAHMVDCLREEGYTRLGVDYEGFNLAGRGFWQKHFTAYTYSVVRKIHTV